MDRATTAISMTVPAVAISTPGSAVRNSHTCASSELPLWIA